MGLTKMKKYGFTLQEALISIGIIGIIAAITIPAVVKFMPDQYGAKYLKAYESLKQLTGQILADSTLYWYNSDNTNTPCDGLACAQRPTANSVPNALLNNIPANADYVQKYTGILAYYMHGTDYTPGNMHFFTSNGIHWSFIPGDDSSIIAMVDFNKNNDLPNVFEYGNDPNTVDTFIFIITRDGTVSADDPYGQIILEDSKVINSRKEIANRLKTMSMTRAYMAQPKGIDDREWYAPNAICGSYEYVCSSSSRNIIPGGGGAGTFMTNMQHYSDNH